MGCRRLYAANTSGASEAAYVRNVRRHGVKIRPVYIFYEINIGDPDERDPGFQVTPGIERIYDLSAPALSRWVRRSCAGRTPESPPLLRSPPARA
jgi:hypothetical protein